MALTHSTRVRVTEVSKITPPESATESSSLPLTFFDTLWFKFHPVERIFFYELTSDSSSFFSSILSRLKKSLSVTLLHFLPFAGNLVWPSNSDIPFILYTPGDGVFFTVAESDADFHSISGDSIREIPDSHNYVPELKVTEEEAATMSFQITLFANKGFCIGISSHHAIFDGKSITLFLKAWAHICKQIGNGIGNPTLPPELAPFLDRTVIQDPEGLNMIYINNWISIASSSGLDNANPRSLKLLAMSRSTSDTNFVRATFILSIEDIKKIRQKVLSQMATNQLNSKYFSTFVLTYSYVAITILKAKGSETKKDLVIGFTADVRRRLNPRVPANYFGNCVFFTYTQIPTELATKEDGLAFVAEELRKLVKGLENGVLDGAKEKLQGFGNANLASMEMIGVAGSPRFGVYGTDFGWGKPKKVEITSIDRSTAISMAENRDGDGGVEVGMVLKKSEMKMFASHFVDGLNDV